MAYTFKIYKNGFPLKSEKNEFYKYKDMLAYFSHITNLSIGSLIGWDGSPKIVGEDKYEVFPRFSPKKTGKIKSIKQKDDEVRKELNFLTERLSLLLMCRNYFPSSLLEECIERDERDIKLLERKLRRVKVVNF